MDGGAPPGQPGGEAAGPRAWLLAGRAGARREALRPRAGLRSSLLPLPSLSALL